MGMAAAALVVSVVGIIGSTLSSIQQARAASDAAEAQAQASEIEAQSRLEAAAFEEKQFRRKAGLLLGKQAAIGAAAGLDITSGSPLFAELDNVRQAELEALNIRRTGRVSASAKEFEARLARSQGRQIASSIPGIAFGGLAQGGSVLSQFLERKK